MEFTYDSASFLSMSFLKVEETPCKIAPTVSSLNEARCRIKIFIRYALDNQILISYTTCRSFFFQSVVKARQIKPTFKNQFTRLTIFMYRLCKFYQRMVSEQNTGLSLVLIA